MKKRVFLVDVTISLPKGLSQDEWSFVDHLYLDFEEGEESTFIQDKVRKSVQDWLVRHPAVHDCYENSFETEDGYYCSCCGKDTTTEIHKLVKLSRERSVNARATDIV